MSDDFYIGYVPKAPPSLGRRMSRIAAGIGAVALIAGGVLILGQPPFAASRFEYGVTRDYAGVIEEWPYPMLVTGNASFLLIAPGKHGLSREVRGLEHTSVRLRGSLIEHPPDRMIEVVPESIVPDPHASTPSREQAVALGPVTLRGEIVDTKCYLGVMNPGQGKVHRDCAVRCISGGAPPAFLARDASGETRLLLLTGEDGRRLANEILPFVAEPLEIFGTLVRTGSMLTLKAEPSQFRRVSE
jgi:hypothetical protein